MSGWVLVTQRFTESCSLNHQNPFSRKNTTYGIPLLIIEMINAKYPFQVLFMFQSVHSHSFIIL